MSQFKIGDLVRVKNVSKTYGYAGCVGVVNKCGGRGNDIITVRFDDNQSLLLFQDKLEPLYDLDPASMSDEDLAKKLREALKEREPLREELFRRGFVFLRKSTGHTISIIPESDLLIRKTETVTKEL